MQLADLKKEAANKHSSLVGRIASYLDNPLDQPLTDTDIRGLTECMIDFTELAKTYGDVPEIGRKIKSTLSVHLKKPIVRTVMCEPKAKHLWRTGQELEVQGHLCCAFLVYEEAVTELPAPSAHKAQQRLERLTSDPQNVKDARLCSRLKWCHQKYRVAEKLAKAEPGRARELFALIVQRAPADSRIHQEATQQIAKLN